MDRRRIGLIALAVVGAGGAYTAFDVWRQYPDGGPDVVIGGTILVLMFVAAYGWPVVLLGAWVGVEIFALVDLVRRNDLAWSKRAGWLAAVVLLAPFFAIGALAYVLKRKDLKPRAGAAG